MAVAAKHEAAASKRHDGSHKAKAHNGGARHARKVAKHEAAAKRERGGTPPERGDPRPLYERGNALLFAGDGKGAIAAYREAVRVGAVRSRSASAVSASRTSSRARPCAAIRALRRYLKLAPNAADRDHHPRAASTASREEVAARSIRSRRA